METHGRNRDSIADIQDNLETVFSEHPGVTLNPEGEECVPARVLPEIFQSLNELLARELLSPEEFAQVEVFATQAPELLVSPALLVNLVAQLTTSHPGESQATGQEVELPARGRHDEREDWDDQTRSSSSDASHRGTPSRPPSRGPPQTPKNQSVFDTHRRQRSTPLGNNAPSSWASRPAPPSRRKSDAGNRSDSDSGTHGGRSLSRNRTRGPSNPTSPTPDYNSLASPTFRHSSRPSSRAAGRYKTGTPKRGSPYDEHGYSSPDDNRDATATYDYLGHRDDAEFVKNLSTLPMPHGGEDSDEEDDNPDRIMDRSLASSTVSMEQSERLEALGKSNQELSQRVIETDKLLRRRIEDHENEIEDYQVRIEELSAELAASKRDEKDLRNKERTSETMIKNLEAELVKSTKQLENSRATYATLQRTYSEQCTKSENYRSELRQRDDSIRDLKLNEANLASEIDKFRRELEETEAQIAGFEAQIEASTQVQLQLDEQKQENLLLKETIDRIRFDLDGLRKEQKTAESRNSSASNTMTKAFLDELGGTMKAFEPTDEETAEEENETTEIDHSDNEEYIQTVITRKRKVASRANKVETITTEEEVKEYSDSSVQYEPELFVFSSGMQTEPEPKPVMASLSIQTEPEPEPVSAPEPIPESEPIVVVAPTPPSRETAEMEVQTDPVDVQPVTIIVKAEPEPEAEASTSKHVHDDQPPAYTQLTEEHDWQVAADALKKWHNGITLPIPAIRGGVTPEIVADWEALKAQLGVDCKVIDKMISQSDPSAAPKGKKRRSGRFYNIYNTYVYGDAVIHTAVVVGASALVLLALGPYLAPQGSGVVGGATYTDRALWTSYNTLQGIGEGYVAPPQDGTATVWRFLGRVGGGAARAARGWPT